MAVHVAGMEPLLLNLDGDFHDAVPAVLKEVVGGLDVPQGERVGDEGRGVQMSRLNEGEDFAAFAAVHAAGFERQVFPIHLGQGQHLRTVVQGHHRHHGVGTGALPGHTEGLRRAGYLQHRVGAAVGAVCPHRFQDLLRRSRQDLRKVIADEVQPAGVRIADDDLPGPLELYALQGADARGPCADDQNSVLRPDLCDVCRPVAGGQHIAHQKGLQVGDAVGDFVEALVGVGHPDELRLSAVDAAAQRPAAVGVGAVVDPAVLAEEAVPAEGLHVHRHPVAGPDGGDGLAGLLHDAHYLVAHGDAGHRPGYGAVLDVQVAGADTSQGHLDDGVPGVEQGGDGLVQKRKSAPLKIGIGKHTIHLGIIIPAEQRKSNRFGGRHVSAYCGITRDLLCEFYFRAGIMSEETDF